MPEKDTGGDGGAPLTKSQLQGEASRAKILDAASLLFSTKGYTGTTISRLSKDAGLPVSSIYWHFGSKAGLLWAVAERGATSFLEALPTVGSFDGEPIERFDQMLRSVTLDAKGREFFRLLLILILEEAEEDNPGAASAMKHVRETALARWREVMREIFAADGDAEKVRMADRMAELVRAVAMGAFITAEAEGDADCFENLQLLFADLVRARAQVGSAPLR